MVVIVVTEHWITCSSCFLQVRIQWCVYCSVDVHVCTSISACRWYKVVLYLEPIKELYTVMYVYNSCIYMYIKVVVMQVFPSTGQNGCARA